jgi:N-acetylglucosamine-6-sulfatase
VEQALRAHHLLRHTVIVFSSDNGLHTGEYRLLPGKLTAFDTDIRVPLIVAGPGVPKGRVVGQVTQNVDLYPTFVDLAGAKPARPVEGRSLVPLLHPTRFRTPWRTVALVEHKGRNDNPLDPDFEGHGNDPTTYEAIRISTRHLRYFRGPVEAVYVEYTTGETEFYDIRKDRYERVNVAARLKPRQKRELHRILVRLAGCHSAGACWSAALPR